ncbi:MAG: DUF5719 family protein [Actinobacteria bacterium]|nr:DUF5719 family protein [Actinomycetota bacterium]
MSDRAARFGIPLVVVAALVVGFLLPAPPEGVVDPLTIPGDPPYVVCAAALAGSGFASTVGVVTASSTIGAVSGVGVDGPPEEFQLEGDDNFVFEVGSLAELGVTPILVERLTGGQVGAGVLGLAGTQATTAGCQPATSAPVALLGMATSEGEQSTIVLANPFAVEATARLVGASEFGPDTVTELETARVPANSTLTLPLSQSMAGRQQLGFTVYTDVGAVVAGMARSGPDIASSEAITGAQQWFVPLPAFGVSGHLIVHNLAAVDANYRLDAVNPDGVTEEVENGALLPDAEIWLSVEDLGASGGYVVTADEPVAVAVVYTGDVTRVVSTASPASTVAWLVPISSDAAGLDTAVWIFNPDEAAITAEIAVFGGRSVEVSLPAGTTTGRIVPFRGRGGMVTATGPVAVFYGAISDGGAASMTLAFPLE